MINLLSTDAKRTVQYARRNRTLVRWVAATVVGIIGIGVVYGIGFLQIQQSIKSYDSLVANQRQQLVAQKLEETQKETEDISSSVKLTLQVLSRQVLFSGLLQQVGVVMPSGSTLQNLTIGKVDGGIDLQAAAKDYQTATQVQLNVADPNNKLFEKADIVTVSCSSALANSAISKDYPCQVTIRALFTKNNPFLFINQKAAP